MFNPKVGSGLQPRVGASPTLGNGMMNSNPNGV